MTRMAIAREDARQALEGCAVSAEMSEAMLVPALRAGRPEAYAELVALFQTPLYNVALRILQDREDAKDVTQEVFLKAFRQLPRQEGRLHLRAWLYKVAINACYDHLRAGHRRPTECDTGKEYASPVDELEQAEIASLFRQSLRAMPRRQQIALLLKDVHGLPHRDIAESLGISRGSAEVLLFRARHTFRRSFEQLVAEPAQAGACTYAASAAAQAVGGRLSGARLRHVLRHAETCSHCRHTVRQWGGGAAVGLGLAVPLVALHGLVDVPAAAAACVMSAAAGGTAAGAAAIAAAAAPAGLGVSALPLAGGLLVKMGGVVGSKAAAVIAAGCVVTAGSVAAYEVDRGDAGGPRSHHGTPFAGRFHIPQSGLALATPPAACATGGAVAAAIDEVPAPGTYIPIGTLGGPLSEGSVQVGAVPDRARAGALLRVGLRRLAVQRRLALRGGPAGKRSTTVPTTTRPRPRVDRRPAGTARRDRIQAERHLRERTNVIMRQDRAAPRLHHAARPHLQRHRLFKPRR